MTQKELEARNNANFERITTSYSPDSFIEYYKHHNVNETLEYFGISNHKQLTKILTFFNYDFSYKKSLNKGKPSTRSHESYVAGGKKSGETQKKTWAAKSEEELQAWRDKQAEAHSTPEFREKISQINIDYRKNLAKDINDEMNKKRSESCKKL